LCALFILIFYLILKKIIGNRHIAILGTLFVLPFNQILWPDPSLRNLAMFFLLVFLLFYAFWLIDRSKLSLCLATIFFFLAILTHPEIAIQCVAIILMYLFFTKTPFLDSIKNILKKIQTKGLSMGPYFGFLDSFKCFAILFLLTSLTLGHLFLHANQKFPNGQVCIFNEIPLSLCQPIGIISFLPFLIFPIALIFYCDFKKKEEAFLLAIASLFLLVIFYFSHIWSLYHRYSTETAYLGIIGLACFALYKFPYKNKLFWISVAILLIVSLYPKFLFINQYSLSINSSLTTEQSAFNLIDSNTRPSSVILMPPSYILNRHIPFYANRYIFAGNNKITKEAQWQVLSTCNGPFAKDCDERVTRSQNFFSNPSDETFRYISNRYEVDYLLLSKDDPTSANLDLNSLPFKKIADNKGYVLYEVTN
jgi:hypothetical protein